MTDVEFKEDKELDTSQVEDLRGRRGGVSRLPAGGWAPVAAVSA